MQVSQELDDNHDEAIVQLDDRTVKILLADDQVFNLMLLENSITASYPNAVIEQAMNGKLAVDKV